MGITIALLFSLGTCIVQIQSVQVDFAGTRRLFNLLAEANHECAQCGSVCHVRNIPFEDHRNSFFLSLGQGVYFLKRPQREFKMLLEMFIVLTSIVSTERIAGLFSVK